MLELLDLIVQKFNNALRMLLSLLITIETKVWRQKTISGQLIIFRAKHSRIRRIQTVILQRCRRHEGLLNLSNFHFDFILTANNGMTAIDWVMASGWHEAKDTARVLVVLRRTWRWNEGSGEVRSRLGLWWSQVDLAVGYFELYGDSLRYNWLLTICRTKIFELDFSWHARYFSR